MQHHCSRISVCGPWVVAFVLLILLGSAGAVLEGQDPCPDYGEVEAGCGEGENYCQFKAQQECGSNGEKILYTGYFECGEAQGKRNCRTSTKNKDVCYVLYDCYWDEDSSPECLVDPESWDPYYNWVKWSDNCV